MPVCESEAVVLQSFPLGEGDRLVSFLTRSHGKLRGVAKGARRPKSRFGSALEPLSYVRLWYFERETRELVRINEIELLESFLSAYSDYGAGLALGLLVEITTEVLPDRESSDPAFRLLLMAARTIKQRKQVHLTLAYFALWSVRLAGWLPPLTECARCGKPFDTGSAYAAPGRPLFLCAQCRVPGLRTMSVESLMAARRMLAGRLDELNQEEFPEGNMRELSGYLLDVIEHHTERKLRTRPLLEVSA
jgi:DNA repair protein RecO (recombination protein O)